MDWVFKASAAAVTAAVLGLVLKKRDGEQALLLGAAAAAAVLAAALSAAGEILSFFRELGRQAGISTALTLPLLKCVGIAVTGRLASDLCRDAGQAASASALELACAVAATCAALPLLKSVSAMVFRLT